LSTTSITGRAEVTVNDPVTSKLDPGKAVTDEVGVMVSEVSGTRGIDW
jgi:hypothetical protein